MSGEKAGKTVALIGTLDTKAPEYDYLNAELLRRGVTTIMVDISCLRVREGTDPEYACTEVARRAGRDIDQISQLSRTEAGKVMVAGAKAILQELYDDGKVAGLMALGGANGSAMACEIMQTFPIGVPKVVVSVMAAGDPRQNAGTKDVFLINSVTDMCLNRVTKQIISNAAAALAGMLEQAGMPLSTDAATHQVGASMLGLTQKCVLGAKARLEDQGAEVLEFHANGIGGAALEHLIEEGVLDAVVDLTTNEVANNALGGVFDAGPTRLEAAAARGIPQVIAPGAVDFINFWGQNIPDEHRDRHFIFHNVQNTLMRTTPQENTQLGQIFGQKLSRNKGRAIVLIPLHGFSENDRPGGPRGVTRGGRPGRPWHDPEADRSFMHGLKATADRKRVEIREVDAHINTSAFVDAVADAYNELAATRIGGDCATRL